MNVEYELSKILSEQLAKEIDAEILKNIMAISKNNVRKASIGKIFRIKASE
jgi:hypothetical protein